ncbi:sensor domain-containing diguanylate cyclase [Desulfovermiculus halophilus]|uniref:sensor domain-containing diguanylate cyclase n=1 Tax=Desulfovermiculus halophilus TaxID=339722 RepID=UPI000687245F|nr:PAS domain S-box protein [Desulfovermiculus halophilus]
MAEKIDDVHLARQLLELMPDAFVLIDEDQRIVQVNPQAEAIFQDTAGNMLGQPLDVILPREVAGQHHRYVQRFLESSEQVKMLADRGVLFGRRKNGERFSFLGTIAKLQLPEGIRLAIIMREVTEYLQSEQRRKYLERASYCLSQSLSAVIQARDETELLQEICRIAVEIGGYLFAWIGFAREDAEKWVQPVASFGQGNDYLHNVFVSWAENDPSGRGPVGRAVRSGKPQFSRNTAQDRDFAFWRDQALQRGFHSVAAFPLTIGTQVLGTLTFYNQDDSFDREEVQLLTTLADNLSFGVQALRTQKERDEKASLLQQNTDLLRERIKELNLLYTISRLKNREDLSVPERLTQIAAAMPQAWQYPDIAQARIVIQGYGEFQTPGFVQSSLSLTHPVFFNDQTMGSVEVVYTQTPPNNSRQVFLPEEEKTIESVAFHVGDIIRYVQMITEQQKLSRALEQTADTVVITDRDGVIEYINPSFEAKTGYSREEAVGNKPNLLKSDEHPPEFYHTMWETILNGDVYRDTVINRAKDGSLYYEYKTITPLYDQAGNLTHFLATGKDLTEQLQTESRLQYLLTHDPVTGLMNHKEFLRKLNSIIAESSSQDRPLAIAALGVDNFKAVNDLLGRSVSRTPTCP